MNYCLEKAKEHSKDVNAFKDNFRTNLSEISSTIKKIEGLEKYENDFWSDKFDKMQCNVPEKYGHFYQDDKDDVDDDEEGWFDSPAADSAASDDDESKTSKFWLEALGEWLKFMDKLEITDTQVTQDTQPVTETIVSETQTIVNETQTIVNETPEVLPEVFDAIDELLDD